MDDFSRFQALVDQSERIVFFGGAGMSTESGIPDFRSEDGLYRQEYDYPPETVISATFFHRHPEVFFRFYRERMLCLTAQPNAGHRKLAELEEKGKLQAVVTQNIDGLHQLAGSKNVLELHGSVHRNHCLRCGKSFSARFMLETDGIPVCPCGGTVKPDVVLYEEPLDSQTITRAVDAISTADLLIVGGTSLAVYPAAGLIDYYRGNRLVLINRTPTPADARADLILRGNIGELLGRLEVL